MKLPIMITATAVIAAAAILLKMKYRGELPLHPVQRSKSNQVKIACVGDSITYGYLIKNQPKNSYPAQLQQLLGNHFCVGNFGYSGRTASVDGDFPYIKEHLYQKSLSFQPNIVLLMLGTNDSKPWNWNSADYVDSMKKMIEDYLALNSVKQIYLLLPPPAFALNGKVRFEVNNAVIQNEIIPILNRLSYEYKLPTINLYSVFEGKNYLFVDGVHPNNDGATLIAETIYQSLIS